MSEGTSAEHSKKHNEKASAKLVAIQATKLQKAELIKYQAEVGDNGCNYDQWTPEFRTGTSRACPSNSRRVIMNNGPHHETCVVR